MEDTTIYIFGCESVVLSEEQFKANPKFYPFDRFELINKEVDRFLELKNNWDGQGSIPVLQDVTEIAKKLFVMDSLIDGISDIFPNPHGTLSIEWTNGQKEKLSLEIGANSYSYFVKYANKNPKFVDGKDILRDTQMLTRDLGELFSEEILNFISS